MDHKQIKEVLAALSEGGWDQATIVTDDLTLTVGAPVSASAPPQEHVRPRTGESEARPATAESTPEPTAGTETTSAAAQAGQIIAAPSVGVAWRSPKPGAAPFVEVGQAIAAGDTVFLLEVMKLFSPVVSDVSGVVTAVLADDGAMVGYGTPLVAIEAA